VYEDTRRLLAGRLGVDPSPELAAIQLAILRNAEPVPASAVPVLATAGPALPAPATAPAAAHPAPVTPAPAPATAYPGPAAAAPAAPTTNLPAPLTSFVGRDEELEQVSKQLEEARLVTLTGPGGAGKTRLATEVAARQAARLTDGVWFVPLAPVRDASDVPQAVLDALGVPEAWRLADAVDAALTLTQPAIDRLTGFLAARRLILILDNCEHVLDAVAGLSLRVLAAAPGVRILATSREPLGVTGETLCPVPSLPLPPGDVSPDDARDYAAVRLFADRAAAVRPGFTIDTGTASSAARICRALDGIPLAIELAAARLRSLTVTQVESRLDDRFHLLATGTRAPTARHQTLRAVVDWSWELLDGRERTVLRRLSVFRGGATPDAAEQICATGGQAAGTIDVIASLVDKSLVVATGEAEVRYQLLETVRVYAAEQLAAAGEESAVADAHARFFLALAERAEPQLRGPGQLRWLDRMTAERDNCSAALRYAVGHRDAELGLRLVGSLMWFWIMRDYEAEGGAWASAVRDMAGPEPPPGLADSYAVCAFGAIVGAASEQAKADDGGLQPDQLPSVREGLQRAVDLVTPDSDHPLLNLAVPALAMFTGDTAGARRRLAELSGHRDPWIRAASRAFGGHLAMNEGEVGAAAADFAAAYAAFESIGDRWGLIVTLAGAAEVAMARGEWPEAVRVLEEARGYASAGLSQNFAEMQLIPLARARAAAGELEAARAELERAVRAAERIGERDDLVAGYIELSELARRCGDLAAARRLLEKARRVAEPRMHQVDMHLVAVRTFSKLGCLSEQEGDLAAAARWHGRAIAGMASEDLPFLPVNPVLAEAVEGFAALAAAQGAHGRAAELLGLAQRLHGFRDRASLEVARVTATVIAAIGANAFAAAQDRGRALTRDDALALAG
jgi:predicted ATPase